MLKKRFRLKNRSSFQYIYRRGKSVASRTVALQYVPAKSLKIGFSVSKKIGNSVVRNRVKRRMRECVRAHVGAFLPKCNLIFVARAAIVNADFKSIEADILYLIKKAELLKEVNSGEVDTDRASEIL